MKKVSEHPAVILLGIIASLLTLYGFFTNRFSVQQIVGEKEVAQEEVTRIVRITEPASTVVSVSTNTPRPTPSPRPTPPPAPTAIPQYIEFDNPSVSIVTRDNGSGSREGILRFQILAAQKPLRNTEIELQPVTQDIAGNWSLFWPDGITFNTSQTKLTTDQNGFVEVSLPPSVYAIMNNEFRGANDCEKLGGTFGILGYDGNDPVEMIVFPIDSGKTTEVTVSLGVLEVALIANDGTAIKDELVYVHPQDIDVAGQPIISEDYPREVCTTGSTGLASFTLGHGTYIIKIFIAAWDLQLIYDIEIMPGEVRRETVTKRD